MATPRAFWVGGLLLVGLSTACASNNNRGRALYADGRFIEAAELFEHSEPQLVELEPRERVRYGLYRGMTLLRLGDLDRAARWLHYAQSAATKSPDALDGNERRTLTLAWQQLDVARSREPRTPDPLRDAIAHSTSPSQPTAPDVAPSDEPANPTGKTQGLAPPTSPNP
ncbi:MAG: tetratricopeptide repeat protein [Polyangiaceae bacterium]